MWYKFWARTTHYTHYGERALCGLQTCDMLLMLILFRKVVLIKDLILEGALDFHKSFSRRKISLFKEWVKNWKTDLHEKSPGGFRDQTLWSRWDDNWTKSRNPKMISHWKFCIIQITKSYNTMIEQNFNFWIA